jgi:hypothetical protein
MDPLRFMTTVSLLLAFAGIGGAFRACGSIAARGAARGAASSARAIRIPPHVLKQLARTPPRVPIVVPPGATGRAAGESALRAGAAGHALGGVGDDVAGLGARTGRTRAGSGLAKEGAGNLDNLADVVTPDGDDDRPRPTRRKR